MTSLTYKNMLAVERDSKNTSAVQLLRDVYHFWFTPREPFEFGSVNDKVVIFYPQSVTLSENINQLADTDVLNIQHTPDGALKFYSDKSRIKIYECKFQTEEGFRAALGVFRQYLIQVIRNLNITDYSNIVFAVHWEKKILNSVVLKIIKECGLLSDDTKLLHKITEHEIKTGELPKIQSELQFGKLPSFLSQPAPTTFGFGTQQPAPTPIPTPALTPTPFQQPTTNPTPFQQPTPTPTTFGQTPSPFAPQAQQPQQSALNVFNQPQQQQFGFNTQNTTGQFGGGLGTQQTNQPAYNVFGGFNKPSESGFGSTSKTFGGNKSVFNWGK